MKIHLPESVEVSDSLPLIEVFEAMATLGMKLSADHKEMVAVRNAENE